MLHTTARSIADVKIDRKYRYALKCFNFCVLVQYALYIAQCAFSIRICLYNLLNVSLFLLKLQVFFFFFYAKLLKFSFKLL